MLGCSRVLRSLILSWCTRMHFIITSYTVILNEFSCNLLSKQTSAEVQEMLRYTHRKYTGLQDKTFTMMISLSGRKRSPLSFLLYSWCLFPGKNPRESKVEITSIEIKVKITFSSSSIKCADLIIACLTINSIYWDKKLQVCSIHSQSLYLSSVECNNRWYDKILTSLPSLIILSLDVCVDKNKREKKGSPSKSYRFDCIILYSLSPLKTDVSRHVHDWHSFYSIVVQEK